MENIYYLISVLLTDGTKKFYKEDPRKEGPDWFENELEKATTFSNLDAAKHYANNIEKYVAAPILDDYVPGSAKIIKCTEVITRTYETL